MSAIPPPVSFAPESRLENSNRSADGRDHWFVGYTKAHEEARAQENLLRHDFERHLLDMRRQKRTKGVLVLRRERLLPRHLVLRPGPHSVPMDRVRSTGLMRLSGLPDTVAQTVVDELKALGEDFRQALIKSRGWLEFAGGPLAGLGGIFEQTKREARAIVLLSSS
jgi:hypothetical protein